MIGAGLTSLFVPAGDQISDQRSDLPWPAPLELSSGAPILV
jgi:hypothetical protein